MSLDCLQQLNPKELVCKSNGELEVDKIIACKSINKLSILQCTNDENINAIAEGMNSQLREIHLRTENFYAKESVTNNG